MVRDLVGHKIAQRLLTQLKRERAIDWGDAVRIRLDGLDVASGGAWELCTWPRIQRITIDQGMCQLWFDDDAKPRKDFHIAVELLPAVFSDGNVAEPSRRLGGDAE